MVIITAILTGVITSGLLCGAFYLGYLLGRKTPKDSNAIEYNEETKGQVKALADWLMFNGGKK